MGIGELLPLLTILFIVAVALLFAFRRWKVSGKPVSKPGNKLVIGYAGILVIGLIAFLFIDARAVDRVDFKKIPSLYNGVSKQDLPETAKDYVSGKWEYPFNQNTVHVKRAVIPREPNDDYDDEEWDDDYWDDDEVNVNEIPVTIGYTGSDKIIVTYYKTPAVFSQGLDITKSIQDPEIEVKNNQIVISMPHLEDGTGMEHVAYKREFPMLQFTKERSTTYWMEHNDNTFFHNSEQRIYIQIPKGANIDVDEALWTE